MPHTSSFTIYDEEMAGVGKRTLLRDVNPQLICPLCRGYLIDATTVVECLHSFCKSCILQHLNKAAHCPSCKHALNKARPNIKADKTLQEVVYKLIPGLYHREMRKRKEFYKKHPEHADSATPEQRGEDVSGRLIFAPEDAVSLSLEYLPLGADPLAILSINDADTNHSTASNNNHTNNNQNNGNTTNKRRYLQCPALVTIAHLKKFIAMKYSVDLTRYTIEICHRRAPLPEHWTLMDVAYIYAWKRIAPMRFFYRIAQEEQRLEAPLHQRPSTPGLGAAGLPPNDAVVDAEHDSNLDNPVNQPETSKSEAKLANNEASTIKDSNKIANDKTSSLADNKQMTVIEEDEVSKITVHTPMTMTTVSPTVHTPMTMTTASPTPTTTVVTNVSSSTAMCNDSNKQIKSPIKIMKNPDGKYEVLKSSPANCNEKEQATTAATTADIKTINPEFSVVSIGSGQNSNGVKITLKQCSPTSSGNSKKPKVISNVLVRYGQIEKDSSGILVPQQMQKNKDTLLSPSDKQPEKQRRKVTFVDRPMPEKTSPSNSTMPKTVLKKPAEQQDKKQFLQGFQLAAKESVSENSILRSPIRDVSIACSEVNSPHKRENTTPKVEESFKKNANNADEVKEKSNIANTSSNTSNSNNTANIVAKRLAEIPVNNTRMYVNKGSNDTSGRVSFSSVTSSRNANANSSHSTAKMDVYTFHSGDPPVVPAGAVKRKCPPGVPIVELKRKRQQNQGQKRPAVTPPPVKLPRTEHIPMSKPNNSATGDHHGNLNRMSNTKTSSNTMLSSDPRNLLDGCGLSIPASLSITLTAAKSSGVSGLCVESNDNLNDNRKNSALGLVNPSITLNNRSVDPRVLKALKAGMPAPLKAKSPAMTTKQSDCNQMNQQRTSPNAKCKRDQESILDLSGGKKMDIHPLRIPQPVTKLRTNNKAISRESSISGISDQGQVVTLMGGHRYYRAPPGSLTPAVHRVNDCSPLPIPSRTPVYAPTLTDVSRSDSNFSSVFPSLQSLLVLSQAPNLQQFQMDARMGLPLSGATENVASTAIGSGNSNANLSSITGMPGKSHLAAQCAPVKPARSSVASLAVPIKQQQSIDKSLNANINRTIPVDTNKPSVFRNNESFTITDETASHLAVQTRYSSAVENANRFLSRSNIDGAKNNNQVTTENLRDSNTKTRNQSLDTGNLIQQQQHHDTASPRVSSTASPSPPPGSVKNDNSNASHGENNINNTSSSEGSNTVVNVFNPTKNNVSTEVTSTKSPASPDSSSIAIESPTGKNCTSMDRETVTDGQTSSAAKTTDTENSDGSIVEGSATSVNDKSKFANQSVNAKQLTSEMVQKRLLAVFPSNEWANNPIAAEHLGNFLKSLNATMKSEDNVEESKVEKIVANDESRTGNDISVKSRKDIAERS